MTGRMIGFSVNNSSGERVRRVNLVRLLEKSFFGMVHRTVSDPSARTVPQSGQTMFTASDPGVIEPSQTGQDGRIMGMVLAIRAQVEDCTREFATRTQVEYPMRQPGRGFEAWGPVGLCSRMLLEEFGTAYDLNPWFYDKNSRYVDDVMDPLSS